MNSRVDHIVWLTDLESLLLTWQSTESLAERGEQHLIGRTLRSSRVTWQCGPLKQVAPIAPMLRAQATDTMNRIA